MPHYVFFCEDCAREFTLVLHISELETAVVKCPECGSTKVHQKAATFSAVTAKKS